MNTRNSSQTSLGNALMSFVFSGVMAPHKARYDYEAPRVTSPWASKRK